MARNYTVRDVAEIMRLAEETVRGKLQNGDIPRHCWTRSKGNKGKFIIYGDKFDAFFTGQGTLLEGMEPKARRLMERRVERIRAGA